jgi:hypothetical protein
VARLLTSTSSEYLEYAGGLLTATPLTMACWFYSPSTSLSMILMSLCNSASTPWARNSFYLQASGATAGDPVSAGTVDASAGSQANTSTGWSANTWTHACGVWTSATDRAAFINGGSKGTQTTSRVPSGIDRMNLGGLRNGTPTGYLNGRIAEAAIWNVALSDQEVAALASGLSPLKMRPTALVGYWPIWGIHSPEPSLHPSGGTRPDMSVTGTALANHAPVVPFSRRWWGSIPNFGTAGAQTISPSAIASAEAFGTAVLSTGAVTVAPSSIASAEAFGTATVSNGAATQTISPSAIASAEAFPDPVLYRRARTVLDLSAGAWTTDAGATTGLYATVDETVASDADYIQSSASPATLDEVRLRLSPVPNPNLLSGIRLLFRYGKDSGTDQINLLVRLYAADGVTLITEVGYADISTLADGEIVLSVPNIEAIPADDYQRGLVVGFAAVEHTGGGSYAPWW